MEKPGISIEIPGHGGLHLCHLVSDYTGTLSYRGKLVAGVDEKLRALSASLDIHVLTADTRGTAAEQLTGLPVQTSNSNWRTKMFRSAISPPDGICEVWLPLETVLPMTVAEGAEAGWWLGRRCR